MVVTVDEPGASAARVVTNENGRTLFTPYLPLDAGHGSITVLGLAPKTNYTHVVETLSGNGVAKNVPLHSSTDALPAELADVTFTVTPGTGDPQPGFYLISGAANSTFAVDAAGAIRWYHSLGAANEESKMQRDGTFTTFVGATQGFQPDPGKYVRYSADGASIASYTATTPDDDGSVIYTDNHELLITTDNAGTEHFHMLAFEQRANNASPVGAWHMLVRQTSDGTPELRFRAWNYFTADDETEITPVAGAVDYDHSNALFIDPNDGNYVMSFRNTDALLKVDYNSGDVLWQLGGKRNQFTFVGDPLNGFYGQHSVRVLLDGDILIYDDGLGHTPPESRAVEYKLDTTAMTATMVWEFRHSPAIFTPVVGSVERLENGHTLVGFALAGTVDEVDETGAVVWEGQLANKGAAMSAYRIMRLPSLYGYAAP